MKQLQSRPDGVSLRWEADREAAVPPGENGRLASKGGRVGGLADRNHILRIPWPRVVDPLRLFLLILLCQSACLFAVSCSWNKGRTDYIGPTRIGDSEPASERKIELPVMKVVSNGQIRATLTEAVMVALENNRELSVRRLDPSIKRTFESQEKAAFEPVFSGKLSETESLAKQQLQGDVSDVAVDANTASASLSEYLPTGTKVSVDGSAIGPASQGVSNRMHSVRGGISASQSLLRDGWTGPNLASLRQARTDTQISEYELRYFAEALVAQVEETYWDYALAERQIAIYSDSLKIAENQLEQTKERIRVGKLAEMDLAAAEATLALNREGLINARGTDEKLRFRLLKLLNPGGRVDWKASLILESKPEMPLQPGAGEAEPHVETAMKMRADLNQARLGVKRGDLELVKTRNGLLPRMDLFVNFGRTGYADSFRDAEKDARGDYYDKTVGVEFEIPLFDTGARAKHRRALLSRDQAEQSLENMKDLVEVDVRSGLVEVNTAAEQVTATAASRKHLEDVLNAENEKLQLGKSTTLLVSQAERDLLSARIGEVQAVIAYLKAQVELYRLEGSLLTRRGIESPGSDPVE